MVNKAYLSSITYENDIIDLTFIDYNDRNYTVSCDRTSFDFFFKPAPKLKGAEALRKLAKDCQCSIIPKNDWFEIEFLGQKISEIQYKYIDRMEYDGGLYQFLKERILCEVNRIRYDEKIPFCTRR